MQHSLAQWKFSFAMMSIEAWLNSSARAKPFHFTPMSSGIPFHENQLLSRCIFDPNQVGLKTLQKIKQLQVSNLGFKVSTFYLHYGSRKQIAVSLFLEN